MNLLFKHGHSGDCKEFIIYIFEQLHEELKRSIKQSNNMNEPLNQYDKNITFYHFYNGFQEEFSIISDLFFGIIETTNECLNCKNNYISKGLNNPLCYNYQIFNCLLFPLDEIRNMKNNSMKNLYYTQTNQKNRVSLYDCFYYKKKNEYFQGYSKL